MKVKVKFYMKSGNVVTMKFGTFSISKLSGSKGNRKIEWSDLSSDFTIDVDEIECVVAREVLF